MVNLLLNAHEDNDTDDAISVSSSDDGAGWSQKKHFMTDDEIAAQLLLFIVAGYHTTATTLTFCLHALATHPDIQKKCVDELEQTVGRRANLRRASVEASLFGVGHK